MSFFGSIKTFFEKFGADFVAIFRKAPSFEQKAAAVVSYVAPAIPLIVSLVDPAALPIINPIIAAVERDLTVVQSLTSAVTVAPGTPALTTVETALNGLSKNIGGILELAEVKNSAKVTQITATVQGVVGEIDALLAELPTSPTAPVTQAAA